ncbi:MAG: hypothetical protein ACR2MB_08380, partial [Acidimicrobiales bacterium]
MADHDDLPGRIHRLAEGLDHRSRPVDPEDVMAGLGRASGSSPGRHRALVGVAAVLAVLLVGAGLLLAARDRDEPGRVRTTGPRPTNYTGTPYDALPQAGIAVTEKGRTTLLDFAGKELGSGTAPDLSGPPDGGVPYVAVRFGGDGPTFGIGEPDPAEAPPGCDGATGAGGVRLALCGGRQVGDRIVSVNVAGEVTAVAGKRPKDGPGHWRSAEGSPNARWVLAQWSGKCEAPTAAIVRVPGGKLRTADGKDRIGPVESFAVGWTPDSKAIVSFPEGVCGTTVDDPPGVYLVDPANLRRNLLHRFENGRPVQTFLWRRNDPTANVAERIFARARYELDLEGCCGKPSHGGKDLTAGVRWESAKIAISATAVDEPTPTLLDDPSTKLGPADYLGIAYG